MPAALAQGAQVPPKGFHKYMVGSVEVTALYDGMWAKPHDPAFIKNASVEETKEALQKAGLPTDFVSVPLTVVVLTIGGRHIMVDAGSGAPVAADRAGCPRPHEGGRYRPGEDQHDPDLAFPSRPHLRA